MNYDNTGTGLNSVSGKALGQALKPTLTRFDSLVSDIHQAISTLENKTELLHSLNEQKITGIGIQPSSASNKIEVALENIHARLFGLVDKL